MIAKTRKLTYQDYVEFPEDGNRHEIIDGDHFMNPAPSTYHQDVSRLIQFQMMAQIEITGHGRVFNAPVDLQLSPTDIVQPDLVVVMNDRRIVTPAKIKGVPNLIVEILLPASEKNDRTLKFTLYEQSGVDEYWIVDPLEHEIERHVMSSGGYRMTKHRDVIQCQSFTPAATVDLKKVW